MPAVVAVQPGASERIALVPRVALPEARDRPRRVIDDEQVEVAVAVVVEERGLGGVAGVRDAVGRRLLDEGRDAVGVQSLVDVQLVGPELPLHEAGVTDVEIEPAIAVHIGEGDAGRPARAVQAGLRGDVAEVELPLVQVQPGAAEVRREDNLREPVAGQVPDRDAAAVVVVPVSEDVEVAGFGEAILEADAGITRGEPGEQRPGRRGGFTRERRPVPTRAAGPEGDAHHQQSPPRPLPEAT